MSNVARLLLTEEEGRKKQPYYDHLGFVTGGIGRLLDPRKPCPLPDEVIDLLFKHDFAEKSAQAAASFPNFDRLNEVQQAVLISMVYQLGLEGVLDFHNMVSALQRSDVRDAAKQGRDSKWAKKDTPERAERQMRMLETGIWVPWEATRGRK
jgi:lysozyme